MRFKKCDNSLKSKLGLKHGFAKAAKEKTMTVYKFTRPPLEMVSSSSWNVIPEGNYYLEITDVANRMGRKGEYLLIKYKVVSGVFIGFKLSPDFISMSPASEQRRVSFLCAIFFDPPETFTMSELKANLLGKKLAAYVIDGTYRTYRDERRNKFSSYKTFFGDEGYRRYNWNEANKIKKELKATENGLRGLVGNGKRRIKIRENNKTTK